MILALTCGRTSTFWCLCREVDLHGRTACPLTMKPGIDNMNRAHSPSPEVRHAKGECTLYHETLRPSHALHGRYKAVWAQDCIWTYLSCCCTVLSRPMAAQQSHILMMVQGPNWSTICASGTYLSAPSGIAQSHARSLQAAAKACSTSEEQKM